MMNGASPRSIVTLFVLFSVFTPCGAHSQANTVPSTSAQDFSYSAKDRRDPFETVYEAKTKKVVPQSKQKEGYDLEELKLVGVLKTGDVKFAMMEDVQGRGLLFKKGDFLNKNLWLLDILEDKVVLAFRIRGDVRKIPMDIPRK